MGQGQGSTSLSEEDVDADAHDESRRDSAPPVLIAERDLETHFQPIVSLRNGTVFAIEALSRALDPSRERLIPPATLFGVAEELGLLGDLDRFCRRRAVESFAARAIEASFALSLNWDTRTLASHGTDAGLLCRLADRMEIPRSRIILEILESQVDDLSSLVRFARNHRRAGFLVAIDDYGTGHSTPERLAQLEPDIIKIDRALVHGLSQATPHREACRAVVQLARSLGALVVAEGIEDDADIVAASMIGIDLFQGFAFARPGPDPDVVNEYALGNVRRILPVVREESLRDAAARRETRLRHDALVTRIVELLGCNRRDELDAWIVRAVRENREFEALYVLDEHGMQITRTAMREAPSRALFHAAPEGADQSLKDYFLELSDEHPSFVSTPYLSMATGRPCVTYSRMACARDGARIVVCCDLSAEAKS